MLEVRRVVPPAVAALAAWVLLAAAPPARGDGIEPDRPGFTPASTVVSPGAILLEGGLAYRSARVLGAYNLPELLVRYGLLPRVELRLGVPDYVRVDDSGNTDHRLGTTSLGVKLQGGPSGSRNGVALLPAVTLPVDPDDERRPAGEIMLAWALGLPESETVSGDIGYAWLSAADRGPDVLRITLAVSRPVDGQVGTFVEWAAELPRGGGAGTQYFHHGYTWPLADRVRMDFHGAFGLTRDAPDFLLGAGISFQP